jgi:hypothetical protein
LTPIVAIRSILNDIVGIAFKKIEEGITQLRYPGAPAHRGGLGKLPGADQ